MIILRCFLPEITTPIIDKEEFLKTVCDCPFFLILEEKIFQFVSFGVQHVLHRADLKVKPKKKKKSSFLHGNVFRIKRFA